MANTHSTDLEKGSSQYFSISDNASLSQTGDITIEAWIKPESSTGNDLICSKWNTTGDQRSFAFYYTSANTVRAFISSDGTNANTSKLDISTAGAIVDGVWQHIAIVYDASAGEIKFYLNGLLNSTTTGHKTSIFDSTADFYIGYFSQDFAYFDGKINNLRYWSDIRTASEIQDNIGADTLADTTNLEGWWKFNNDATDESSNSNDLTANNSPTYTTDVPFSGELTDVANDFTLATGIVSYWELEEASGTRADSTATGNDLTDNNTVTSRTGKIGDAAEFDNANTEYLSHTDDPDFDITTTNERTMNFWVYLDDKTTEHAIAGKWAANGKNWLLRTESTGIPRFYVGNGGSSTGANVSATTDIFDSSFHMVTLVWNGNNNDTAFIYIDGVLEGTTSSMSPTASTAKVGIGADDGDGSISSSQPMDGAIDEVAWWTRALTAGEVHNLYNGGSGLAYDSASQTDVSTDATLTTGLVSYWELEEASGTRVDSHGSNNLTDNNTVTSGTGIQGDGADFEASNSEYLSIADASQSGLDVTTGLSFSFWMNLESAAAFDTNKGIFSKTNRTNGGYLFGYRQYPLNNDNFYFETYNGGTLTFAVSGDLNLSTSTFYHIVATFNSGTFNLYVNGVNQTFTKTGSGTTISDSSDPFYLGRLQHDGSSYFDGIIDEFGLWNRALTAGEVHKLYNGGSGLPYQAAVAATFIPKVMWL